MKILLDHNLDRRLKGELGDHEAFTGFECGWADLSNGVITAAEADGFNVMLTADANISQQQNLDARKIAIIVLRAFNNRRTTHLDMMPDVRIALQGIQPGTIVEILHPTFRER